MAPPPDTSDADPNPNLAILFNDKAGPDQVIDIIQTKHAFVGFETYQTEDEQGRTAYLLLVYCETATPDDLYELIGNRLPDYIQARRFPISRLQQMRDAGE